jgi:hypothetical protein
MRLLCKVFLSCFGLERKRSFLTRFFQDTWIVSLRDKRRFTFWPEKVWITLRRGMVFLFVVCLV